MEVSTCEMTWDTPRLAQNYKVTLHIENREKILKGLQKAKIITSRRTVRLISTVNRFNSLH